MTDENGNEIDIDDIIEKVRKKFEEEERGTGSIPLPAGSDISDTERAARKEAFEATEPPKKKPLKKRLPKPKGEPIAPGIAAFGTLDEAMSALREFQEKGGVGFVLDANELRPEDFSLPKEAMGELRDLLQSLKKLCEKWNIPAIVQIQQWRQDSKIAVAGFRHIDPLRAFGHMLVFSQAFDVIFRDATSQEDLDKLTLLLMQLHQKNQGGR